MYNDLIFIFVFISVFYLFVKRSLFIQQSVLLECGIQTKSESTALWIVSVIHTATHFRVIT